MCSFGVEPSVIDFLILQNIKRKNYQFVYEKYENIDEKDILSDKTYIRQELFDSFIAETENPGEISDTEKGSFKILQKLSRIEEELKVFLIVVTKSIKTFEEFNKKITDNNILPEKLMILFYCKNASFDDILKLRDNNINRRLSRKGMPSYEDMYDVLNFEYFLIDEDDCVRLLTFVWYTPQRCSYPQLIEVNRFDKKTRKWQNVNFVINKFENFHGCKLMFGVSKDAARVTESVKYTEMHESMISGLARHLNFSVEFNPLIFNQTGYPSYANSNSSVDMLLSLRCFSSIDMIRLGPSVISKPYVFKPTKFAIPPGENYSQYEKLLKPFDWIVWCLIFLVFATAFVSAYLLASSRRETRNLYFGETSASPSLNIVMIFFGLSQLSLPLRNFPRFLIMIFILYCLIIRTAWQGKMFEFMTKNITKPEIQSFDELVTKNYTCYMLRGFHMFLRNMDLTKR